MGVVLVEAADGMFVSGDAHDDGQPNRIAIEVADGVFEVIVHHLHKKPVAGGDKPQFGREKFERNDRTLAGKAGEEHPTEVDQNGDGDGAFQKGAVNAEVVENAGEKDQGDHNHQRFGGQGQTQLDIFDVENNREGGA